MSLQLIKSYIALGSNLDNPQQQILQAIDCFAQNSQLSLIKTSSFYQSKAVTMPGTKAQPDYINAVVLLETPLSAHDLLKLLQQIEIQQGRIRTEKWSARTLDLDIILYGDKIIESETLSVPHPLMCERNFVLCPLAEISSGLFIPGKGFLQDLLKDISTDGLIKL